MLNNTRTPDMNQADLMALIAGCRVASKRVRRAVRSLRPRDLPATPATC